MIEMKFATQWPPIRQRYAITVSVQKAGQSISPFTTNTLMPHGPGKPGAGSGSVSPGLRSRSGRSRDLTALKERVCRNEDMTTSIKEHSQQCTETGRRMRLSGSAEIGTGEEIRRWPPRQRWPPVSGSVGGHNPAIHRSVWGVQIATESPQLGAHEEYLRGDAR